jgi:ABC-type dipeptide/oligopeptide/nickel transport system permease subunit
MERSENVGLCIGRPQLWILRNGMLPVMRGRVTAVTTLGLAYALVSLLLSYLEFRFVGTGHHSGLLQL